MDSRQRFVISNHTKAAGGFLSAVDLISSHLSRFRVHAQYVCIWAAVDTQREAEELEIFSV